MMMMRELKKRMTSTTKAKLGALMMKDQLKELKAAFDYTEYGGAPILGVRGIIVKMHGSSDAYAVKNAVLATIPFTRTRSSKGYQTRCWRTRRSSKNTDALYQ